MSHSSRALVIRLGAVGDVVRVLGAVGRLRGEVPGLEIDWLVEEGARALVEGNPAITEAFVFERRGWSGAGGARARLRWLGAAADLRRRLRRHGYWAALDFQGTLKSGAWALASGAPLRIGFCRGLAREGSWLLMNRRVAPPPWARSRLQQFLALAEAAVPILGGRVAPSAPPGPPAAAPGPISGPAPGSAPAVPLPPLESRRAAAARWLEQRGLGRRPWVLLCPGSSRSQEFKRWPAPRFAEAGRRLAARGVGVVIGWGPGEEGLAREVEAGCAGGAALAPEADLLDLAALASLASAFVGNDSGPMHLAWAVGTPVVAIFGPTDPELNAPPGGRNRVLYEGPPRRAGERRVRRPLYLDRVRAEEVEAAVLSILGEGAAAGARAPGAAP
jgi:ADP-heptose:LPS heptosyltransferase